MRNNKKGFTLAELLLCLGIIGVITALGLTIAKHSVDNAYNKYWVTGYSNLYNAIAEIDSRVTNITTPDSFSGMVNKIFTNANNENAPDKNTVVAANGIRFYFEKKDANAGSFFPIDMRIPQAKTRNNKAGIANTRFIYSVTDKLLVPVNLPGSVDLSNRADLLPFYVDDGVVGREGQQSRKQKVNFTQAFCSAYPGNATHKQKYAVPSTLLGLELEDGVTPTDGSGFFYGGNVPPTGYTYVVECP